MTSVAMASPSKPFRDVVELHSVEVSPLNHKTIVFRQLLHQSFDDGVLFAIRNHLAGRFLSAL